MEMIFRRGCASVKRKADRVRRAVGHRLPRTFDPQGIGLGYARLDAGALLGAVSAPPDRLVAPSFFVAIDTAHSDEYKPF